MIWKGKKDIYFGLWFKPLFPDAPNTVYVVGYIVEELLISQVNN